MVAVYTILLVSMVMFCGSSEAIDKAHNHGPIKMGISLPDCDDAKWNLQVDWDSSTDLQYKCQANEHKIPVTQTKPFVECLEEKDLPDPIHHCMNDSIEYKDKPPRGGPHRPLWPVYGEYEYIPPQRWVHAMEHGGVVFLYHPCANPQQVEELKDIARSCLRRHIITPYRDLNATQSLAVVTYRCKLTMSKVDRNMVERFVKEHALKAPEKIIAQRMASIISS